jgi:CheY-like chemotaxis protein
MPQRILVVDEDKSIIKVLRGYLEQSGYQVLTAADGETALHMLRRERPDLVILDLMMPDLGGWEVTRIVRADKVLAGRADSGAYSLSLASPQT